MEIWGIKFVPWNTPLKERLEALAAGGFLIYMLPLTVLGPCFLYYLIFYTRLWTIVVMYLIWLYLLDTDTPEQGGRKFEWVRNWPVWEYVKNYFPITLAKVDGVELDPKRNYLFACFPHGIIATGATLAFGSNACDLKKLFPDHETSLIILDPHFKIPIYRDLILSRGGCASSARSLNYLLGHPKGGNAVALFIGGVAEQMNAHPGTYELVLKNRKGFIKLALQNGSPLVPVFSFGENDIYTQLPNPHGSLLRIFQEWCKRTTSFSPFFINGRGIFQYNFGLIPKKTPINVLVGKPIEVNKVENPTKEEIDALHEKFIEELVNMFEENKYKYGKDPENIKIVIT